MFIALIYPEGLVTAKLFVGVVVRNDVTGNNKGGATCINKFKLFHLS